MQNENLQTPKKADKTLENRKKEADIDKTLKQVEALVVAAMLYHGRTFFLKQKKRERMPKRKGPEKDA